MDYSFERAFTIQEKQYMLAYRHHARDIQGNINKLKGGEEEQGKQELIKDQKIAMFQNKLNKIRSAALWLDHITQEHTD